MLNILAGLLSLGWVICWVIVLIKLFKEGGVLQGILGFICGLWTFIWGWMNSGRLNLKTIMLIWTVIWILLVILGATGNLNFQFGTPPATTP
jgi:hypothetical protein